MDPLFKLTGHRGAAALAPENTLESFKKAHDCGATAIEFDVRLTKDGVPIIVHDENLRRLAGIDAEVSNLTLNEIKKVKIMGEEPIPTLEEVLEYASDRLAVDMELKIVGAEKQVVKFLEKYGLKERSIVTSFIPLALLNVKQECGKLRIGIICGEWDEEYLDIAKKLGADTIIPNYKSITPSIIKQIKNRGLKIFPWTVNTVEDALKLVKAGVDGIITDDPCTLSPLLSLSSRSQKQTYQR